MFRSVLLPLRLESDRGRKTVHVFTKCPTLGSRNRGLGGSVTRVSVKSGTLAPGPRILPSYSSLGPDVVGHQVHHPGARPDPSPVDTTRVGDVRTKSCTQRSHVSDLGRRGSPRHTSVDHSGVVSSIRSPPLYRSRPLPSKESHVTRPFFTAEPVPWLNDQKEGKEKYYYYY